MNRRRKQISAALIAGALCIAIVPLQAAVADSSPPSEYLSFEIQSPGDLIAKGVAVALPIEITCTDIDLYGLDVSARQRVNAGRIANGYGYVDNTFVCDGAPHIVDVTVEAYENAFKPGKAFVTVNAFACTPDTCTSFSEAAEIRFKN